jgi:hypothetical protein
MNNQNYNSSFFRDLFDYKLRKYITRRVASAVYLAYLFIIPVATLIGTYLTFDYARHLYLDRNFHWQLLAIWIIGPIVGLIVLIYTRLLIELNIAVVNIAENTEPNN